MEREFNLSSYKRLVSSMLLCVILSLVAVAIPKDWLLHYQAALFIVTVLCITLAHDKSAWLPFAVTKTEFGSALAIPMLLSMFLNGYAYLPGFEVQLLLVIWFGINIANTVFSKSPFVSYFGNTDRNMGLAFRMLIPVLMLSGFQLNTVFGDKLIPFTLLIAGIVEAGLVWLQYLSDKFKLKIKWWYKTNMSGRYLGTILNPLQCANFLLVLMPVAFLVIDNAILSSIAFVFIGSALLLTAGRATLVAGFVEVLMLTFFTIANGMFIQALVIIWASVIFMCTPYFRNIIGRLKKAKAKIMEGVDSRQLLWKDAWKLVKANPFGTGVDNISNPFRKIASVETADRYPHSIVDRTHNHYIDMLVEGGIVRLVSYMTLLVFALVMAFTTNNWIIGTAIIVYTIDVFFSFPLQPNHMVFMLLFTALLVPDVIILNPYALLILIPFIAFNLITAALTNRAMRYMSMAISFVNDKHDFDSGINAMYTAIDTAPWEESFFNVAGNLIYAQVTSKQTNNIVLKGFEKRFNEALPFIQKNCRAPDNPINAMAAIFGIVGAAHKKDELFDVSIQLSALALKYNPTSMKARRNLLMVFWHKNMYKEYVGLAKSILKECLLGYHKKDVNEKTLYEACGYCMRTAGIKDEELDAMYKMRSKLWKA